MSPRRYASPKREAAEARTAAAEAELEKTKASVEEKDSQLRYLRSLLGRNPAN